MIKWIKKMPDDYYNYSSGFEKDVMLWQNNKVYVMDNHRDAAWCWLQQCKDNEKYNFMHIDMHYDLGDFYGDEDLEHVRKNPRMSYEDMMSLKRKNGNNKILRWDNYIRYVYELRPDWFTTNLFITQKKGCTCEDGKKMKMLWFYKDGLNLISWLNQYLVENPEKVYDMVEGSEKLKWIVNLDLDFFFYRFEDDINIQLFTDDYIRSVAKILQQVMDKIQVLTIAISPECLAGKGLKEKWDNGFRILEIMAEEIYALWEFPFPKC